jgi:hypothetical protein
LIVLGVVLAIFSNPTSSLNPFPPATLPPTIQIPTATRTPCSATPHLDADCLSYSNSKTHLDALPN